jgi:hypothetical protein
VTHYETLEISPRASAEVVRAAYRSLIQRWHPDRHPGDAAAAQRAAAITQAYEVLSDVERRQAYDHALAAGSRAATATAMSMEMELGVGLPRRGAARRRRLSSAPATRGGVFGQRAGVVVAMTGAAVAVAAFAIWLALPQSSSATRTTRPREMLPSASLQRHPPPPGQERANEARQLADRTVELLDAPIVLAAGSHELTLPRVQVVIGSVDAAVVRAQLQQQRERWLWALGQHLSREHVAGLRGVMGEARLRLVVMRALNETLGTRPDEEHPATEFESPGRSGVLEVTLPEGVVIGP